MAQRKSTGKRLRFEVFKRDGFTCQYCGKQPPDVVLVIDHIVPVCEGGETTADNLITACEVCNQGKAGKVLGQRQVRPDGDMMYLETQQEIAELRRYQLARKERDEIIGEIIRDIRAAWPAWSGVNWSPGIETLRPMFDRYSPEIVEEAIRIATRKIRSRSLGMYERDFVPYIWATMKNMARERGEE